MLRDILIYQRERSPLPFVILLATLMFCAGLRNFDVEVSDLFIGAATMSVYLLFVRLGDDIADMDIDRHTHPHRALCDGRARLRPLQYFMILMVFVMVLLQWGRPDCTVVVVIAVLLSWAFLKQKARLSAWTNVVLLNASLAFFPVYAGLLLEGEVSLFHGAMAAFFWAGGIAHDLSHCVVDDGGDVHGAINPINRIPGAVLAKASLSMFGISAVIGATLFLNGWTGFWFGVMLGITSVVILLLEYRLIRRPCARTAKPFYTLGFVFFLLPVAGHLVDLSLAALS